MPGRLPTHPRRRFRGHTPRDTIDSVAAVREVVKPRDNAIAGAARIVGGRDNGVPNPEPLRK